MADHDYEQPAEPENSGFVSDRFPDMTPIKSLPAAFDSYWSLQMLGNDAKAREPLKTCASRGVPMPFDVK